MGHIKSLLYSNQLAKYVNEQSLLNFTDLQKQIDAKDAKTPLRLSISADQAGFLTFLTRLMQPKKVIEIGSFEGFSTLAIAKALSPKSQLFCLEKDPKLITLVKKNLSTLPKLPKLFFYAGEALDNIKQLSADKSQLESFDFAFIDADKKNNYNYFLSLLALVKKDGVLLIDNAIPVDYRSGEFLPDKKDKLNLVKRVFEHPAVEANILTLGAGFLAALKR